MSSHLEDFRTLVMQAGNGICQLDADFRIRFANPCLVRMLARANEAEILGLSFTAIIHTADRAEALHRWGRRRSGQTDRYELTFLRADGSAFPVFLTAVPLHSSGIFTGSFAIIVDITQEKELLSRLETSEARFRSLAEQLPAAICEIDPDSSIHYLNAFAARLLDKAGRRFSDPLSLRDMIADDGRRRYDRILDGVLSGKQQAPFVMDIVRPGEKPRPSLWSIARFGMEAGMEGARIVILDLKQIVSTTLAPDEDFFAPYGLTLREVEVARLLCLGLLYKEIAHELCVTLPTVRTHVLNLYRKLDVHSRAELADFVFSRQQERYGDATLLRTIRHSLFPSPAMD